MSRRGRWPGHLGARTGSACTAGLLLVGLAWATPTLADTEPTTPTAPQPTASSPASPSPQASPEATPTPPPTATADPTGSDQPSPLPEPASREVLPLRPGDRGYLVAMAQRRLIWLGARIKDNELTEQRYGPTTRKAVSAFQVKFFGRTIGRIGKGTWDALTYLAGPIGELPAQCTQETSLCIDMEQRLLRYVSAGKVLLTLDARFGMPGNATAKGSYRVQRKSRNHVSSLYRTWMPFAMFFYKGQAVHYSPYFARDGYNGGSHGCINLRDIKMAEWLFDRIPIGTRVYVYQ